MSLKPKTQRFHEPKFREREPDEPMEFDASFDALAIADVRLKPFGPCTNDVMRETLTKALNR